MSCWNAPLNWSHDWRLAVPARSAKVVICVETIRALWLRCHTSLIHHITCSLWRPLTWRALGKRRSQANSQRSTNRFQSCTVCTKRSPYVRLTQRCGTLARKLSPSRRGCLSCVVISMGRRNTEFLMEDGCWNELQRPRIHSTAEQSSREMGSRQRGESLSSIGPAVRSGIIVDLSVAVTHGWYSST